MLSSSRHTALYQHAHRCIEIFVEQYPSVFGPQSVTYNVHILLHLIDFVHSHGPISNFSTIKFENYLGLLKRRVKPNRFIFSNILKQVADLTRVRNVKQSGPIFKTSAPDNCALVDNKVILIDNVRPDGFLSGAVLVFRKSLYEYPYCSRELGIGYYASSRSRSTGHPSCKMLCIPVPTEFVVFPFL